MKRKAFWYLLVVLFLDYSFLPAPKSASALTSCEYGNCTPTLTPTPNCTSRPKGDANCDTLINDTDYGMWASYLKGITSTCVYCSVDFNKDTVVNLIDYETWRVTRYN